MKIGLAYDLKEAVVPASSCPEDTLDEYDSPETVAAIADALENLGHSVVKLGGGKEFIANILQNNVDFVFNISKGLGNHKSREAQVPSILEMLDIPYEGSSKGIRFGSRAETVLRIAEAAAELLEHYNQPVLVEEFIAGDEVTVSIIGNSPPKILGIMRVLPRHGNTDFIYSLEVKRDWEQLVDYECPAQLETGIMEEIKNSSLKIFKALGCRDFARLDFKLSPEGMPYFLEINPLAGLNPKSSDLPIMANKLGLTYQALLSAILNAALQRYPQCVRE